MSNYSKIILGLGCEGLGDILCAVPAIKMLNKAYDQKIKVLTKIRKNLCQPA